MSVHPKTGYLLSELLKSYVKDVEKEQALLYINKINVELNNLGMESVPFQDQDSALLNISIGNLKEIRLRLKPLIIELSLINPKFELSTEFIQLKKLIDEDVVDKINQVNLIIEKLHKDLKREFKKELENVSSKTVTVSYSLNNEERNKFKDKFEQYFSFSDFKPLIDQVTGDNILLKSLLSYEENYVEILHEIFSAMKQQVLAIKANLPELVNRLGTDIININDIKESDPIAYEYLKIEAFSAFFEQHLGQNIAINKAFFQEMIHPNHNLAKNFEIKNDEMAIVTIAAEPIMNVKIKVGQELSSQKNSSLKYHVMNQQEIVKHPIALSYKVNNDLYIKVIVPIYISLIRTKLIKTQRSSSVIVK